MPLRMAAKIPRSETRYYKDRLAPMIDGAQIPWWGSSNDTAKGDLLEAQQPCCFPSTGRSRSVW